MTKTMSSKELKEMFTRNEPLSNVVKMVQITNLMQFVNVNLQMDRTHMNYYYEIDIDELASSNIPNEEYEEMKKYGWTYNKNTNKLVLYLKSNFE